MAQCYIYTDLPCSSICTLLRHSLWPIFCPFDPIYQERRFYKILSNILQMVLNLKVHESNFFLMSLRKDGPKWLTRKLPCATVGEQLESLQIWKKFLNCQILYFVPQTRNVTVVTYQPNLVARQFGIFQVLLCSGFHFMKKPTINQLECQISTRLKEDSKYWIPTFLCSNSSPLNWLPQTPKIGGSIISKQFRNLSKTVSEKKKDQGRNHKIERFHARPEISMQSSHGTSPSKETNEDHSSLGRKEPNAREETLISKARALKIYLTKGMTSRIPTLDSFLTKVFTPSQSL